MKDDDNAWACFIGDYNFVRNSIENKSINLKRRNTPSNHPYLNLIVLGRQRVKGMRDTNFEYSTIGPNLNHFGVAKILIENGIDLNTKDKYGYTPLMHATTYFVSKKF
jgi:ankyrin repeat protein